MKHLIPLGIAALVAMPWSGAAVAKDATAATKPAATAKEAGPGAEATRNGVKKYGGYAEIATDMTPEQRAKLESLMDQKKAALGEFDTAHSARKAELEKSVRATSDKTERGAMNKELGVLKQQRAGIDKDYKDKIEAIMTPAQKAEWAGRGIYSGLLRTYRAADLTGAQKDEIKKRCLADGEKLAAADAKQQEEIKQSLRVSIESEVLTAPQRDALKRSAEEAAAKWKADRAAAKVKANDTTAAEKASKKAAKEKHE